MGLSLPEQPEYLPYSFELCVRVAGIPYNTTDPFILRDLPDVYVVGNQPSFEMEKRRIGGKEVVLVAVPNFASSGVACMLNLNSLSVQCIQFNVDSIEEKLMEVEEEKEEEEVVIDEDIMNEDGE